MVVKLKFSWKSFRLVHPYTRSSRWETMDIIGNLEEEECLLENAELENSELANTEFSFEFGVIFFFWSCWPGSVMWCLKLIS